MPMFYVSVELVANRSGTGVSQHFVARSDKTAIRDAHLWADNRCRALAGLLADGTLDMFVGCVKLYRFKPQSIEADGYIGASTGMCCYEWKHDWPAAHIRKQLALGGIRKNHETVPNRDKWHL